MDIQAKRKELTALVDNIKENSDRLTVSHTLPALELSVLISKIAKLYEEAIILKHEIAKLEFSAVEELLQMPELAEKDDLPVDQINQEKDQEVTEVAAAEENSSKDVQAEDIVDAQSIVEDIESEIPLIMPYEVDFQDLNTKLSGKEDGSVADQMQKQPIADLTTAVGLNERYLYSNELFGGNMDLFREALKVLNSKPSFSDAKAYINDDLAKIHNWDDGNELVGSLMLLVERRFR